MSKAVHYRIMGSFGNILVFGCGSSGLPNAKRTTDWKLVTCARCKRSVDWKRASHQVSDGQTARGPQR